MVRPRPLASNCEVSLARWQGQDLNLRPSGYEPNELPNCSTLLSPTLLHRWDTSRVRCLHRYHPRAAPAHIHSHLLISAVASMNQQRQLGDVHRHRLFTAHSALSGSYRKHPHRLACRGCESFHRLCAVVQRRLYVVVALGEVRNDFAPRVHAEPRGCQIGCQQ